MPDGDDRRLGWYRQMLQIRLFEEKVQELFMSGQIEGTTHLCQGQEAVSVGAVSAMRRATSRPTPTEATARRWPWAWTRRSPSPS